VARRAIAVAVGILVLILLVVGIKGCLDARKQRGLENYASDVSSLVKNSDQLSTSLFRDLDNPGASGQSLTEAIDTDKGTADALLNRAQEISAPGDVSGAHASLVQTFQLRSDGIGGLASALQSGGSARQTQNAAQLAVDHMKELVASDVTYIRSKDAAEAALASASVSSIIPPSVFVPDPSHWLSTATFLPLIGTPSGNGGSVSGTPCPKGETCGLGLASASIGGAALTTAGTTTVSGSSVDVTVQNQGTVDESNVQVTVKLSGGGGGTATIPSIPGNNGTKSVSVKISPAPKSGASGTLTVSVQPVDGEHIKDNNTASYPVSFTG
jgi:hypothetical protein